jgi:hypothetical protein
MRRLNRGVLQRLASEFQVWFYSALAPRLPSSATLRRYDAPTDLHSVSRSRFFSHYSKSVAASHGDDPLIHSRSASFFHIHSSFRCSPHAGQLQKPKQPSLPAWVGQEDLRASRISSLPCLHSGCRKRCVWAVEQDMGSRHAGRS